MNSHYTGRIFNVQDKPPNQTLDKGEHHEKLL
jgi:hypothetical protein